MDVCEAWLLWFPLGCAACGNGVPALLTQSHKSTSWKTAHLDGMSAAKRGSAPHIALNGRVQRHNVVKPVAAPHAIASVQRNTRTHCTRMGPGQVEHLACAEYDLRGAAQQTEDEQAVVEYVR